MSKPTTPTPADIGALFDAAIASAPTPERADDRRLLKAYFTDPAFRAAMAAEIARINGVAR